MSDEPVDISGRLAAAQRELPVALPDTGNAPLEITIRMLCLTIAQKHVADATVRDADMYQALKLDNKPITPVSVDRVLHAALVFERYVWGEWSKGIAEHAIENASTAAADFIEEQLKKTAGDEPEGAAEPTGA